METNRRRILAWITLGGYVDVDDDTSVSDIDRMISEDEVDLITLKDFDITHREWDVWQEEDYEKSS